MDPEIGKVAVELTGKVAESAVPTLLEKVFGWRSSSKKVNENVTAINTRPSKPRGEWARRHGKKDRRVTNISQRLRKGFWFEYHRKTEAGKFDEIHVSQKVREGLFAALVTEACKYKYFDRSAGSPVEPPVVVDLALEVILADWNKVPDPDRKTVVLIEKVADYVTAKFNVMRLDRRQGERREVPQTGKSSQSWDC